MKCPASAVEYDANDIVELTCSVEYSGYTAPSLNWTDAGGNTLDAVYNNATSTVL